MGEYSQATHNQFTNVNFNGDVSMNSSRAIYDERGWTWKTWFQGFGSSKIDECLRSLYFEEYQARRMNVTDRDPHTFEWIWEHSGFRKWEQSTTSSLLWLQGKPASGKSTMMKYIRLDLEKRLTKKSFAIDFFYSDRGGDTQRGHEWMLRSLLYQILFKRRDVWKYYRKEFKIFKQSPPELQLETLKAIFYNFKKSCPSAMTIFVLIDAMDESDMKKREDILNMLSEICDAKGCVVLKVLVASRPIPRIQSAFQGYITITLEDETKADIEGFVLERMEKIRKILGVEKTEVRDISGMVVERSQCVFLWVKLVLDELEELANTGWAPIQIKHELEKIPAELGELYDRTLQRLVKAGRLQIGTLRHTEALKMLQWVAYSEHSLDPLELLEAVAVETSEDLSLDLLQGMRVISYDQAVRKLQDRCGGFLEVKNGVVQFIHQTVREFFLGLPAESSLYLSKQDGIENIVTTSLRYIKFINTQLSPGCKSQDPKILDVLFQFLNSSRLVLLNYAVHQYQNLGLSDESQQGNTVFQDLESARQEFISHISTLFRRVIDFDRHQDINVPLNNRVKISLEQEDIIKLLEGRVGNEKWGILVNALIKYRMKDGNIDQTIYNTISQKQKLVNNDHRMERLLDYAASNGYEALVQLSLVNGEDINFQNKNGWTAFHFAICGGHLAIVNLLLEYGADKEAKTYEGITALHLACANGCDHIAKFLIEKVSASKTARNNNGQMPLYLLIEYMFRIIIDEIDERIDEIEIREIIGREIIGGEIIEIIGEIIGGEIIIERIKKG